MKKDWIQYLALLMKREPTSIKYRAYFAPSKYSAVHDDRNHRSNISIVQTFQQLYEECQKDNESSTPDTDKSRTLVIVWVCASEWLDLIYSQQNYRINKYLEIIKAKEDFIGRLIGTGYRHIVVINLPDVLRTPLCKKDKLCDQHRDELIEDVHNFNHQISEMSIRLTQRLRDNAMERSVDVFDVWSWYDQVLRGVTAKMYEEAVATKEFTMYQFLSHPNQTELLSSFLFWDKVHPNCWVHEQMARNFLRQMSVKYHFPHVAADNLEQTVAPSVMHVAPEPAAHARHESHDAGSHDDRFVNGVPTIELLGMNITEHHVTDYHRCYNTNHRRWMLTSGGNLTKFSCFIFVIAVELMKDSIYRLKRPLS